MSTRSRARTLVRGYLQATKELADDYQAPEVRAAAADYIVWALGVIAAGLSVVHSRHPRPIVAVILTNLLDRDPVEGLRQAADLAEELARPAAFVCAVAVSWRQVAERHRPQVSTGGPDRECRTCIGSAWPCPDQLAAVAAARAYLDPQPGEATA